MSVCRRHQERGMTLALVAVIIVALLAIGAIAVDIGMLYTARTSAQHAADSAALAGAFEFMNPCNTITGAPAPIGCTTIRSSTEAARDAARSIAPHNSIFGDPVVLEPADIVVDELNHRVTVTVRRTGGGGITTFFARVFGVQRVDVLAEATAEAGQAGTATRCIKPIYLPNTILSDKNPVDACNSNPQEILFDSTNHLTDWAQNRLGSQMEVRPTNPSGALVPSQFYSLDFGAGAATYRCAWSQCLNDPECKTNMDLVRCGQSYPIETGNMLGPTEQGVGDLIGNPPDVWAEIGKYYQGGDTSMPVSTSKSLALAPVWDDCDPTNPIDPGKHGQSVKVVGFVEMFVDGWDRAASGVKAHLVRNIGCDSGGAGATGANTGPLAVPVRLVQSR